MKMPSTQPSVGAMKNCTPRLAWMSDRLVGLVGLSSDVPAAVLLKKPGCSVVEREVAMLLPEAGRSGVLLYLYSSS